jgi:hypothetical protein
MMKLVNVLMQAIADRQGMMQTADAMFLFSDLAAAVKTLTRDATYVESDHPRGKGGQWTSGQHSQAAEKHGQAAQSTTGPEQEAHNAAAEAHAAAAKHISAQTGLGAHMSKAAHEATKKAGGMGANSMGAAYGKLKAIASDPNTPVLKRSEAIKQLGAIEKAASEVAESPHAVVSGPSTGQRNPGEKFAGAMAANRGGSGSMESAAAKGNSPAGGNAVGPKPTQSTAKGAKPAVHQLLSSGHPFSVDELMKATGVTNKVTIMTALSDLKNPKYAGQLGALTIEKGADGMYKVTKAPAGGFKAVGAANAPAGTEGPNQSGAGGVQAGTEPEGMTDPLKVVHGSHPLSDFMPGQALTAKGVKGTQYKVLGHNAEGHVVVQNEAGQKHNMEPSALKAAMAPSAPSKPAAPAAREDSGVDVPHQPSGTAGGAPKPGPAGGSALPMAKDPKGFDRNPVQNVQARIDAKRAEKAATAVATAPGQPGAPKLGPDGKPMGTHPALAAAKKTPGKA